MLRSWIDFTKNRSHDQGKGKPWGQTSHTQVLKCTGAPVHEILFHPLDHLTSSWQASSWLVGSGPPASTFHFPLSTLDS